MCVCVCACVFSRFRFRGSFHGASCERNLAGCYRAAYLPSDLAVPSAKPVSPSKSVESAPHPPGPDPLAR